MFLNYNLFDCLPFIGKYSLSSSDDSNISFFLVFLDFLDLTSSSESPSSRFRLSKFASNSSSSDFLIFRELGKLGILVTYSEIASYNLTFIESL